MKYFALVCALTVFAGHLAAVELITCPKIVPDRHDAVVLKSNEDKCVQLKTAVAKQSETIKQLLGKNQAILPLPSLNNLQLKDIATIMDQGYGRTNDFFKRTFEAVMNNQNYLIRMIDAANYLHIERILNAALDVFAQKILKDDLPAVGKFNEESYAKYKEQILDRIPNELGTMLVHRQSSLFPPATLAKFYHAEGAVDEAVFSPDGSRVLTASRDRTVKLWDSKVREKYAKPLATLRHASWVTDISFSPDGKRILTASHDDTAKLWDAKVRGENVQALATLKNLGSTRASFSSDGKRILTRSSDNVAKLWDVNVDSYNPQPILTLKNVGFGTVELSQDGTRILGRSVDSPDVINLWDANAKGDGPQPIAKLNPQVPFNTAQFSPDGKYVAVLTITRGALLWDAKVKGNDSKPLAILKHDDSDAVIEFQVSPEGNRILTSSLGTIALWNAHNIGEDTKPLATVTAPKPFGISEFSPDGRRLLITPRNGVPSLWDTNAKGNNVQPLAILGKNREGKRVTATFSPDGKYILTVADHGLSYWNANLKGEDAAPIWTSKHNNSISEVRYSPDGMSILAILAPIYQGADLLAFLDTSRTDLAQAQAILYARKNKLKAEQLPKHLLSELSDEARTYLSGE